VRRRRGPLYAEWNAWAINRPHLTVCWLDDGVYEVAVSWGNGNSDPVWLVNVKVRLPRWAVRYLDRRAS